MFRVLFLTALVLSSIVISLSKQQNQNDTQPSQRPRSYGVDKETIEIILKLITGKLDVKWKDFDLKHKSAYMRYYRKKDRYKIDSKGRLTLDGNVLVPSDSHKAYVDRIYNRVKGTGSRKLFHKIREKQDSRLT